MADAITVSAGSGRSSRRCDFWASSRGILLLAAVGLRGVKLLEQNVRARYAKAHHWTFPNIE